MPCCLYSKTACQQLRTLFAEQDETLLTSFDPRILKDLLPRAHGEAQLPQWRRDMQDILADLRSDN